MAPKSAAAAPEEAPQSHANTSSAEATEAEALADADVPKAGKRIKGKRSLAAPDAPAAADAAPPDAETEPDDDKTAKGPAAKKRDPDPKQKPTTRQRVVALATWASGGAEADNAANEEEQALQLRDPSKSRFFSQKIGLVPEPIKQMFESSSRADKTAIINCAVKRDDRGRFFLSFGDNMFKEVTARFTSETGTDLDHGVTRTIANAKCGQAELENAVRNGEVSVHNQNGVEYYVFKEIKVKKTTGKRSSWEMTGSAEASEDRGEPPTKETTHAFRDYCSEFTLSLGAASSRALGPNGAEGEALGDEEKSRLTEGIAVLSKMRVEAERVWVNMTSATSNGQLMKDELAKKLQQVLDQISVLNQINLFGKLNDKPVSAAHLKELLRQ
ncbi:unnamed protein product, partial [Effrenium voratum]